MQRWTLPVLSSLPGVASLFLGRGEVARPDPATLVPWTGRAGAPMPLATVRQIHSGICLAVTQGTELPTAGRIEIGEGDALVTTRRGVALAVATADCLPLVAADPEAGVLAVVHAGWRGTLAGILETTLSAMVRDHGARAERLRVGAGPAAGPCCYQTGPEVAAAFAATRPADSARIFADRPAGGGRSLDLIEANRIQAEAAGVRPDRFEGLGICSICHPAQCHSFRRDGAEAGRMWTLAALLP